MKNKMLFKLDSTKNIFLAGAFICGLTASPLSAQTQAIPTPEEIAQKVAEQAKPRTAVPFEAQKFDKNVGYYRGPVLVFTITRKDDRFFIRLTGQNDIEVFPESETKFFAKGVPVQISFYTDASGRVTQLVLHQGLERVFARVDEATAKSIEKTLADRLKNQTASPGTEAMLRRIVESRIKGQPLYEVAVPALASAMRQQLPITEQLFKKFGALKAIKFTGVGPGYVDIYEVEFENAKTEWRIQPLTPEGKVNSLGFRELP